MMKKSHFLCLTMLVGLSVSQAFADDSIIKKTEEIDTTKSSTDSKKSSSSSSDGSTTRATGAKDTPKLSAADQKSIEGVTALVSCLTSISKTAQELNKLSIEILNDLKEKNLSNIPEILNQASLELKSISSVINENIAKIS
jgi:hypothetical protein